MTRVLAELARARAHVLRLQEYYRTNGVVVAVTNDHRRAETAF